MWPGSCWHPWERHSPRRRKCCCCCCPPLAGRTSAPQTVTPGSCSQTAHQFVIEPIHCRLRRILLLRQRVGRRQNVIRDGSRDRPPASSQSCAAANRKRQAAPARWRSRRPPARSAAAHDHPAAGASAFLENLIHAGAQGGKGRSQAANDAGEHRQQQSRTPRLSSRGRSR